MEQKKLERALSDANAATVSAKDAHISDLQQTIGLQIALSNRLLNALIPTPGLPPAAKPGEAE